MLRVAPLNLNSKKLDKFVAALGPSYLRVGGSEADKIFYLTAPEGEASPLVLTKKIWDELNAFIQRNDLGFMFTFKYGLFNREDHGAWSGGEVQALLQYNSEKNYTIDVAELGNELNAYWVFHGLQSQPLAKNLANDYATFSHLIRGQYPKVKICGPGSAFWPRLGETIKPFSNITRKFLQSLATSLDVVDWHYYPFQSKRSPLRTRTATLRSMMSPKHMEDFARYSAQLLTWRDEFQPDAQLWAGETGSGQCGGESKLSDRFVSSFWWADQLGRGALVGHKVMVRQSLIGGDYSLIDRLTLKPRPDYWLSLLWCKLMGQYVYKITSSDRFLRVYCHGNLENDGKTVLIINMSKRYVNVELPDLGVSKARFELVSKKLTSKTVLVNGVKPKFKLHHKDLSSFPQFAATNKVKPYSINFWCFSDSWN